MGLIIGKFRKKKTSVEMLEKLDTEIKCIEDFRRNTEQTHKKIVKQFLLFSIGTYVVLLFLFYFYFYPSNFKEWLITLCPLILAPVFTFSLKRLLTWYYNRKLSKNQTKLQDLKEEKKKLLDTIMETEPYKVVRGILEKYAPEQVKKVTITNNELTPVKSTDNPQSALRNRFAARPQGRNTFGAFQTPTRPTVPAGPSSAGAPLNRSLMASASNQLVPASLGTPMPRGILPKDRSVFDKMVEYLLSAGPNNRYALICKFCSGHNGMAIEDEFEYLSFKCCYCFAMNPARKKRPVGPVLGLPSTPLKYSDTSESEKNSGTDSSDESHKAERKVSDNGSDFEKLSDSEIIAKPDEEVERMETDDGQENDK